MIRLVPLAPKLWDIPHKWVSSAIEAPFNRGFAADLVIDFFSTVGRSPTLATTVVEAARGAASAGAATSVAAVIAPTIRAP